MPAAVARTMERWAADWARRRQGTDSHTVALGRRRVYILPTRFGAVFAVMVFGALFLAHFLRRTSRRPRPPARGAS